ncbi:MAG: Gfo/Idh/MocA family oxidoreductase [Prosthecobacter sp.]|jgi:predicted dehydrogenase|uniref:Gfo/Idh/MocA family protein n=1 Tax=Prosthecobacter sp. TaxID=1965333 RepID=UPI001A0CAC44|nr:Gfo/Idh/MocA family oxidoreductase [Prosthecobacter sp.]MBE2282743.1 Gfo/Idh/MocA family oxidoreductase [Prosthecobacter sp.]
MSANQPVSSRRQFIARSATAAAAFGFPAIVSARSPNAKLNLVFIGVGGRATGNIKELTGVTLYNPKVAAKKNPKQPDAAVQPPPPVEPRENVVALCDVNGENLDRAAEAFKGAKKFRDFRQLYDKMSASEIDAVIVSTTEHTHAYATLPALLMKKHVYCEKPLTHNVAEARLITKAAAEAGVVTQMGTQIHGMPNYRRVVELIQSGAIGKVTEAHVCVSRAWGLQSKEDAEKNGDIIHVTERPTLAETPPPFLDWDLWIGPAPMRPYSSVYFPGPKWYRWWDFGNGTMSDLGSHWNDLPFWALKLDAPLSVEAFGPEPHPEIAPASMHAVYEYGPRGDMPACKVHWHQGASKPDVWKNDPYISKWSSGVLFVGDKGMLLSDYGKHVLLPEADFKDFQRPKPFIADSPGHHAEFLAAIKNGTPTGSPFSYAGPLTEANHLGNVAHRAGGKIVWDAKAMRITNNEAANRFLSRTPREGWKLG